MSKKTLGEQRVRIDFNVSNSDLVDEIKRKTAELINLCQAIRADNALKGGEDETPADYQDRCGEQNRHLALAQTAYEEAGMWAVKAATA